MAKKIDYCYTLEFDRDLKRLAKRFPTLKEDLQKVQEHAIELYHLHSIDSRGIFRLQGFSSEKIQFYKIKKFACKSLKGRGVRSGIRIIYAFHSEDQKAVFIEMYYKEHQGDDADFPRIEKYLRDNND
jgi:hypothetical protein